MEIDVDKERSRIRELIKDSNVIPENCLPFVYDNLGELDDMIKMPSDKAMRQYFYDN